jgi:aquaporin Z
VEKSELKKYLAEMIGTFVLVLGGCGTAVVAGGVVGPLGVAIAFGLTVLVMCYAIGHISGCHINPAITVAMRVAGKISNKDTLGYIVAQCIGAIVAAGILALIVTGQAGGYPLKHDDFIPGSGLAANGYGSTYGGFPIIHCFIIEMVLTALFLFVIFACTRKKAPAGLAGIPIGLTLTLIHLISIPITNTSVNPARSLGPALLSGGDAIEQLWLFILAPIAGGVLAALLWKYVFEEEEDKEPKAE